MSTAKGLPVCPEMPTTFDIPIDLEDRVRMVGISAAGKVFTDFWYDPIAIRTKSGIWRTATARRRVIGRFREIFESRYQQIVGAA